MPQLKKNEVFMNKIMILITMYVGMAIYGVVPYLLVSKVIGQQHAPFIAQEPFVYISASIYVCFLVHVCLRIYTLSKAVKGPGNFHQGIKVALLAPFYKSKNGK